MMLLDIDSQSALDRFPILFLIHVICAQNKEWEFAKIEKAGPGPLLLARISANLSLLLQRMFEGFAGILFSRFGPMHRYNFL